MENHKRSVRDVHVIINETPWEMNVPAFKVFGNLYFVGNRDGASWLVDSGKGLILFDTNYPTMDSLLINSIWSLGYNPADIVAIFHTHGHYDHIGATALIKALSGAQTYLGEADAKMFIERPELSYMSDVHNAYLELFEPDVLVRDGDEFDIGKVHIRAVSVPGHSPGATCLFFNVSDGEKQYIAGLHGGAGLNTLEKNYREQYHVDWRESFLNSIHKVINEPVDIFLGNHTAQNHAEEKRQKLLCQGINDFIDSQAWKSFLTDLEENYYRLIGREE